MKKVLIIFGIFVFFLGLLALVLFKIVPTAPKNTAVQNTALPLGGESSAGRSAVTNLTAPDTLTNDCFAWYVHYYASVQTISYEQVTKEPTVQRCFTSNFLISHKIQFDISETDPILIAPDYAYSWLENVQTHTSELTATSATVELLLGHGADEHAISVHLIATHTGWQIDSLSSPETSTGT